MTFRTRATAIVGAVLVLLTSVCILVYVLLHLQTAGKDGPVDEVEVRRFLEMQNVSLAYLENHEPERSIPLLREIVTAFPQEAFGPRNLAVAHVLALGEDFEQVTPEKVAEARAALELAQKIEGDSRGVQWLSARVDTAEQRFADAEKRLAAIVAKSPGEASAWYELFLVRRQAKTDPTGALAALGRALDLEPSNLYLIVEYLRSFDELAGQQQQPNADVTRRLQQIRSALAPFQIRLATTSNVDILQMIDRAIDASRRSDAAGLRNVAGQAARVLLGIAAEDRNLVRRHVLEFVLARFSPEFYAQHELNETEAAESINVSFRERPDWRLQTTPPTALTAIHDIEVADFDLDGAPDLIVLDASGIHVFGQSQDRPGWRLLAESTAAQGMVGIVAQDLDSDFDETPLPVANTDGGLQKNGAAPSNSKTPNAGDAPPKAGDDQEAAAACPSADIDLVAFGPSGVVVLRNQLDAASGARTLQPIQQAVGNIKSVVAAAAADLDADGDLDLALATNAGMSIWSNRGNATFDDITSRSSLPPAGAAVTQMVALDWDRDVDVDLLLGGEQGGWLENLRHGQMRWHAFDAGFGPLRTARSIVPLDIDENGSWDLAAALDTGVRIVRTTTPRSGVVRPLDEDRITALPAARIGAFDYDNDGLLDLFAWRERPIVYHGRPNSRFQQEDLIAGPGAVVDVVACDLDTDGDMDLVLASSDGIRLFFNEGGNQNAWLDVSLKARQIKSGEASASGRVNADGIGSLLELKAANHYQPAVVSGQRTHFGLGERDAADVVRIVWLNGVPQNIIEPAGRRAVCELQVLTGSCPYLYTWNGTAFEFVTDLLWASPLGLQAADGVLLPWRDWEYLKIPGEQLAAKDGKYVLQLTEELWEAAYFDEVKLIAVDHPADVEIYSNEKVGPPDIASFKIHPVRHKRTPVAAHNHRGRSLLSELAAADGVYAKPFDTKLRQGLAEDHYMELDLGDLHDPKRVMLFLTGWIYPSGTSLNVAISQNPNLPQPKPPSLLAPDKSGAWREAMGYTGFPGGKTKTIAIDVTEALATGDSRLRLATNLELYWDEVFFTVDEPAAELRFAELTLDSADLHYRGFSRIEHVSKNGPERFIYQEATTAAKWPPMQGRFTRYGDVVDLLRKRDDRLVVAGAGDEITLRFGEPSAPPPPGWKRDFILYNVGWDKDANLCTVLGKSAEPLPFAAMKSYPPGAQDVPPGSEEYLRYLHYDQTRQQSEEFWRTMHERSARP